MQGKQIHCAGQADAPCEGLADAGYGFDPAAVHMQLGFCRDPQRGHASTLETGAAQECVHCLLTEGCALLQHKRPMPGRVMHDEYDEDDA